MYIVPSTIFFELFFSYSLFNKTNYRIKNNNNNDLFIFYTKNVKEIRFLLVTLHLFTNFIFFRPKQKEIIQQTSINSF